MPILMWLIDAVVNNATLLARSHGANVDTLGFRRSIARTLLTPEIWKYEISTWATSASENKCTRFC